MNGFIVDKRNVKNKSASNRKAFIDRYKHVIKKHVDRLSKSKSRSITDIAEKREITINKKDIKEPEYQYDNTEGVFDRILPGNKKYTNGDKIPIPQSGAGQGGSGNKNGDDGVDEFTFTLTEEEFYDILFSGMALPDFIKEGIKTVEFSHMQRAGYRKEGSPCQLDLKKTFENAIARRIATRNSDDTREVPYLDDIDLRYKNFLEVSKPSKHAVMFCILDVSGSMDEELKFWAKKYFLLLYVFLKRVYTSIEVVFIRHHDTAQEVEERDFFYAKDTGGTTISSAFRLTADIIKERYPEDVNIYISQCSDGDNNSNDNDLALSILQDELLEKIQYYAYIEVCKGARWRTWTSWLKLLYDNEHKKIAASEVTQEDEIFRVFRELFKNK